MDKKQLSEQDIRTKFITPAIVEKAGWDKMRQMREEVYFTDGRIMVRGNLTQRGKGKKADYLLYYKPNIPVAIVEAKDNKHSVGDGMQQALEYAEILDIPFVYSANGDGFLEHDRTVETGEVERNLSNEEFPTPEELWQRYKQSKGITDKNENIVTQDYYRDDSEKTPRYYQLVAINRTLEAVANGQNRILLVMATGTGKTFTAFQIIWRLWKSGTKKRILFLADRNILVDQTKTNDFKPFGDKMTKVSGRQVNKAFQVYLALYQAITGPEEQQKIYRKFSRDFFDLIVVDECHRGSAAEDSAWREILEYFNGATQIGMTATPKETKYVSNINYFGNPVYTYSLKQGIQDGFLAPYKVIRVTMDKDDGWRPTDGQRDREGEIIPDEIYNLMDFDQKLVLDERTKTVAARITEFLKATNRYDKTIVFCTDVEHAERMRQALVNENPDLVAKNHKYVMRITGDNQEGKNELDNFIMPTETYPVIATTSRLMSTGVDAKTCKLIVIDRTINSMTEFKQIIGRGTRIEEDFDKRFFTIIDFRRATNHFADPDFDGFPVLIYEPQPDEPMKPEEQEIPENPEDAWPDEGDGTEEGDPLREPTPEWDPDLPETGRIRRKIYVDGPTTQAQVRVSSVSGEITDQSDEPFTIFKYVDTTGFKWVLPGGLSMAIDSDKNILIQDANSENHLYTRYDSIGVAEISGFYQGPENAYSRAVSVDNGNGFYVTASLADSNGFSGMLVSRYDADGSLDFTIKEDCESQCTPGKIEVDKAGNIYLAGVFRNRMFVGDTSLSSRGDLDIFVLRYNSDTSLVWALSAGNYRDENVKDMKIDSRGNVYLAGEFNKEITFGEDTASIGDTDFSSFFAKLTADGKSVFLENRLNVEIAEIHIKSDDSLFLLTNSKLPGYCENLPDALFPRVGNFQVSPHDSTGSCLGRLNVGGPNLSSNTLNKVTGLTMDLEGNIYLVGQFGGVIELGHVWMQTAGFLDIFIQKYASNGDLQWVRTAGGGYEERSYGIEIDQQGGVYFTGVYKNQTAVGPHILDSGNISARFIAKLYDPDLH